MTPDQEKKIVARILLSNEIANVTISILGHIIERLIKNGDDFEGRAGVLIHHIEQLEAINEAAKPELEQLRIEFGLPPIPPDASNPAG